MSTTTGSPSRMIQASPGTKRHSSSFPNALPANATAAFVTWKLTWTAPPETYLPKAAPRAWRTTPTTCEVSHATPCRHRIDQNSWSVDGYHSLTCFFDSDAPSSARNKHNNCRRRPAHPPTFLSCYRIAAYGRIVSWHFIS